MDFEELTWREQEILALLAKRLTNREIAVHLHLAESTVKDYVSNILGKLYVKNRRQAVARGEELGILGAVRTETAQPENNLPAFTSPFVGRSPEREAIEQDLKKARLLTISGPGGAGKTRLAVKSAETVLDKFRDGVFLVSLASIDSADQIIQTLAEAVGIPLATAEAPIRQVISFLQPKQLLLVIDNFEHLMESAPLLEQILHHAPDVKILVTARARLNLHGEVNYQIGGLAFPSPGDPENYANVDAVELFVQNARSTRPSFIPSSTELEHIASICRFVGGMPLAIEMAASWLNVLALDEIRSEIEQNIDFLSSEKQAVPDRQRSIRAVFDQTWAMLEPNDQDLFAWISIFRGGFTREAARNIANASVAALSRLVNRSIVRFDAQTGRYQVHELLRQYALEHLQTQTAKHQSALEAHAVFYADLMAQKWDHLRDARQLEALKVVDQDIENIRAAWRFQIEHSNSFQIQKFLNTFWIVYWIRGWNMAAVEVFGNVIERLRHVDQDSDATVRAHAMANQAFFLAWLGEAEKGYELAVESIKILETKSDLTALYFAYHGLTLPAYYLGKLEEEKKANIRMLEIVEELGDKWLTAFGNFLLSITLLREKDLPEAEWFAQNSLDESRSLQDLTVQSVSLNALGHIARWRGDFQKARIIYQESVDAANKLGFRWAIGNGTKYLGQVALKLGDLSAAENHFLRSLSIAKDLGLNREISNLFFDLAQLRIAQDRIEEAVELLGHLIELPESRQERLGKGRIRENAEQQLASLKKQLSPRTFEKYLIRGKEIDPAVFIAVLLQTRN